MNTNEEDPKWQAAASFAAWKHCHQLRKDGRTPYAAHPTRVALTIACIFGITDEAIISAALLHDTIEDTTTDFDLLSKKFGRDVATIVAYMSKDMRLPEEDREPAYDRQLAQGPWQSRLLKLADVYDNLSECSPETRAKTIAKAHRALKLAANDPELTEACAAVKRLVKRMEAMLPKSAAARRTTKNGRNGKPKESRRLARV